MTLESHNPLFGIFLVIVVVVALLVCCVLPMMITERSLEKIDRKTVMTEEEAYLNAVED